MIKLQINITLGILGVRSRDFTQTRVPMSTFDAGTCALVKTTLGSAAKVLRQSQSAASVLRTLDFYENSSVIDGSITGSLLISYKIIEYDSPFFPDTRHTKIIRVGWCTSARSPDLGFF
mgnify:CR=1 FL=1